MGEGSFRDKCHRVLFDKRTKVGFWFEEIIMVMIVLSVFVVMMDSIESIRNRHSLLLSIIEWFFTVIFTIEYGLRLYSSRKPMEYAFSFFGIIDLLSIIPSYLAAIFTGIHTFLIIRILRVFRIFRLFKLVHFSDAGSTIWDSIKASRNKIIMFLIFVLLLVTILGSILYVIEGGADSGFTSIPISIYWAIVTLTTVGYGDIAPVTTLGQLVAAMVMILGYSVIAVPTGIVTAEFTKSNKNAKSKNLSCGRCGENNHQEEARYCFVCGKKMI